MAIHRRFQARRQLDRRLTPLREDVAQFHRPPRGWIRAIRYALGMTADQMGKRMGVSRQRAQAVEKAELSGSLTLDSLEKAARALECRVVYALVPVAGSLEEMVASRASKVARRRLASIEHTMALEAQPVDQVDYKEHLKNLTASFIERTPAEMWEDDE